MVLAKLFFHHTGHIGITAYTQAPSYTFSGNPTNSKLFGRQFFNSYTNLQTSPYMMTQLQSYLITSRPPIYCGRAARLCEPTPFLA